MAILAGVVALAACLWAMRWLELDPDAPTGEPEPRDEVRGDPDYYQCGCRRQGGVGDPGCASCTEPGLRR